MLLIFCLLFQVLPLFKNQRVESVLGKMIEPPEESAVQTAIDRLKGVGALDSDCDLTPLGFHLASLPVDVRDAIQCCHEIHVVVRFTSLT